MMSVFLNFDEFLKEKMSLKNYLLLLGRCPPQSYPIFFSLECSSWFLAATVSCLPGFSADRYFHGTRISVYHSDLFPIVFSSLFQRWITALTIPAKTTEHVKTFQMATIALALENSKDKTAKV